MIFLTAILKVLLNKTILLRQESLPFYFLSGHGDGLRKVYVEGGIVLQLALCTGT